MASKINRAVHTLAFDDDGSVIVKVKSAEFLKPTDFIFERNRVSQPVELKGNQVLIKYLTTARLEGCR